MKRELVCVGLATSDTIVVLPRWPVRDSRIVVDPFIRAGGGPAATAAVAAARLGRDVSMVGAVGDDEPADAVRTGLEAEGVDTALLAVGVGTTSESVILVDAADGSRTIVHAPGTARPGLGAAGVAACRAAEWIHVDHVGWTLVVDPALGEDAPARGRISIDAGNPVPDLDLAGLGVYAPTAAALSERYGLPHGRAVLQALDEGALRVVVTLGAEGALAADRGGAWRVAAPSVEVVSTLGAGDVFHGALMAMLLERRTLPEALRAANLAAALSCRAVDGRTGIPTLAELESAMPGSPPVEPIDLEDMARGE